MTRTIIRLIKTCLALCCLSANLGAVERVSRPNVLIVMTDDQGLGDFSFTGNPVLKTPHLDEFARQAVRLTDFHVCPMCSPTRGQLMTGLTALRNGATSVTAGRTFLRPGLQTLPEAFANNGYQTGLFGKWHLGDSYPHRPIDKGFHQSIYHLGWGQLHSTPEFDWPLINGRYFHNAEEKRYSGHCTDFWFDSAMNWMKSCLDRNEPFLCYLATNAPHAPHIELDEYTRPYQEHGPSGFFGMISHIDQRFGDIERFLSKEKLRDNTIVIFMTDNGGTAGVSTFNAGLRGGKTTYYEGGHRVPCWIRWPNGKEELGETRDVDVPTQNTDLLPTLCDWCGLEPLKFALDDKHYQGVSLASLLSPISSREPFADRKLVVQYGQIPKKYESCVIWGRWRLVKGTELYDVVADRAQKVEISALHPNVVREMRDFYENWWNGLEPMLDEFVPISLGSQQQPVVELTSGDWEGVYADNTGFVREAVGGPTGGHWHVFIEEPGDFKFKLRRWPEQTRAELGGKYEPSSKSPTNKPNIKTVAFPTIAAAKIDIAGVQTVVDTNAQETAAIVLAKNVPQGKTTLKAWFTDSNGKDLCGAFFVTVSRQR